MRLKTLIRYPLDVRRAHRMLASRDANDRDPAAGTPDQGVSSLRMPASKEARPILLDLQSTDLLFDCGRHLMTFAYWSAAIGSPLHFRCRPIVLAAMSRKFHGRELLAETDARWIDASLSRDTQVIPDGALVFSDSPTSDELLEGKDCQIIRMLIGRDLDPSIPIMPYPMHPWTLRSLSHHSLEDLRQTDRRCRVFFAGNQKPKYGADKMLKEFGVNSRLSLLQTLRENFGPQIRSHPPIDQNALLVLLDSRNVSIAAEDWLPTLADADFFLCCPGAAQPMCHNLVEAMSVGTVPILEYSHRLSPHVVDGENAICFRGLDGLIDAIGRVESMSIAETQRLRAGAARYYDNHLRGESFLKAIRDGDCDVAKQSICMPFHEHNLYDADAVTTKRRAA